MFAALRLGDGAVELGDPYTNAERGILSPPTTVVTPPPLFANKSPLVTRADHERLLGQRGMVVWLFGLSGAGKSTLADALTARLHLEGRMAVQLDGDSLRTGLCRGLGFTDADRSENLRRAAEVARLAAGNGLLVICSFITPLNAMRTMIQEIIGSDDLLTVYVHCPYAECARRDPKGLYAEAERNQRPNFTGRDSRFEDPDVAPDLQLETAATSIEECTDRLAELVHQRMARGACPPALQAPVLDAS